MATRLTKLLTSLEPIPDDVERRVDQAVNGFRIGANVITDWEQWNALLADFYAHLECGILGVPRSTRPDLGSCLAKCWELVRKSRRYGDNAPQAMFEIARTGHEGGVRKVLQSVAEMMTTEAVQEQAGILIGLYWSANSHAERIADSREYVHRHEQLLPPELTEGSAARIHASFRDVLKQHPLMMRRMRRVGRHV